MADTLAIGVDFGATKIATALVSSQGKVLASRSTLTGKEEGVEAVLDRMANEINSISQQAEDDLLGVGIGVPGLLKPEEGILIYAHNLGWNYIQLVEEITSRLEPEIMIQIQT